MGGCIQEFPVLVLAEVLGNVHMEGGTAVEVLHEILSVELELVDHAQGRILRIVEVRAVEVVLVRYEIAVLLVPLVVLGGKILCRNELGVEHCIRSTVLAIGDVDGLKYHIDKLSVSRVRRNLESEEFGCLGQTVHADGQVLLLHIDEAGLVNIEHIGLEEVLDNLVEGNLVLVDALGHLAYVLRDVVVVEVLLVVEVGHRVERLAGLKVHSAPLEEIAAHRVLDEAVEIDGHH